MSPPGLISPGSLQSQGNEMGTFSVQMICLILDIFFHLLPKSGQIITTSGGLTLNDISSLSKMTRE